MRRETGPWTPTVHAFLRHLREHGFAAAPAVLGIDEIGREIMEFIPGQTLGDSIDPKESKTDLAKARPWPPAVQSDDALAAIGRLYADLHRAARGFRPIAPIWREYELPLRDDEIVCHGDPGPWNVIYRNGLPVALIDWDSCRPDRPTNDLAGVAWSFVPLGPEEHVRASGFTGPFDAGARLRLICEAYGLSEREAILRALGVVKQTWTMKLRYWQPLRPSVAAALLRSAANDLEWLEKNTSRLRMHLLRR